MSPRSLGVGLLAVGVGGFFAGLFGLAGELSIYVAGAGLLLFVAGLLLLLFALRKGRG